MFRIVAIAGFVILIACLAIHYAFRRPRPVDLLKNQTSPKFLDIVRKLLYLLVMLSFIVLVITSLYPTLILGRHMSGYLIMLHTTAGGVFAGCLTLLVLLWAQRCRFGHSL